ncbi:MAG: hypothetical protein A2Z29_03020 [Chloroflexi bacterium RBG_16_56_11]|nr:MAG: hypothetical protein A2Z29_03020 [Chloroflexi bacterium RBG_16_56_11]
MARQVETFSRRVQFDVMDGEFVPSRSVTCRQIAALKTGLTWEAHLMVRKPEDCLDAFHDAGAAKIVFHYEACPSPEDTIRRIKDLGMKAGLAINPETPGAAANRFLQELESVLFLSVNPGYYGSKFIPGVLDKIASFRRDNPDVEIGIDGGIKLDNVAAIARTGVNVIYVGSAVFLQPDPAAAYRRLVRLAADATGFRSESSQI